MQNSAREPVIDRLVRIFVSPVFFFFIEPAAVRRNVAETGCRHIGTEFEKYALSDLKNRRCVMKPMPDADENRRLGEIENDKADRLPPGSRQGIAPEKGA